MDDKGNESSKIKKSFEKLYGRSLTEQELFSIKYNLIGFFNTLIKLDKQIQKGGLNGSA